MTGVGVRMHTLSLLFSLLTILPYDIVHAATPLSETGQHFENFGFLQDTPIPGVIHGLAKRQEFLDFNYTGPVYQSYNFSMPIDHFNTSDDRTYQNRYWINDTYYEEGGPVIWYDYGEGGITDSSVSRWLGELNGTTAAMELARQYHGLVVLWELRYFGYSIPFPLNLNQTYGREPVGAPETWKYNTLEQGLEDAAYFANHFDQGDYQRDNITALLPQNTPWIFIGGSYPGVRAASVRARNPEVFFAAWSSSAPMQAMYDGSTLFSGFEMSLYSNCSTDIKAIVKYADEIMSGVHGPEAYDHLQRLAYAASSSLSSNYNASQAAFLRPFEIASTMATIFRSQFYNYGAVNTTWIFCDALETFNPNATGYNTTDAYLSIVTNPGNALPSDNGLLATHNNNLTLALEAYFYAYEAYTNFTVPILALQREVLRQFADGKADGTAWEYIVNTQFGWYSGSNPANISIVSTFYNVSTLRGPRIETRFSNATIASFPARPNTEAWNKVAGWRINPTNVMFTAGAWDPWRAGSVFSLETDNGAPGYQPSEGIPACGAHLDDPNARFGVVYPEAVHVPDLSTNEEVYGTGPNAPFTRGMALFTKALDAWLPCFGNGTSSGSTL